MHCWGIKNGFMCKVHVHVYSCCTYHCLSIELSDAFAGAGTDRQMDIHMTTVTITAYKSRGLLIRMTTVCMMSWGGSVATLNSFRLFSLALSYM